MEAVSRVVWSMQGLAMACDSTAPSDSNTLIDCRLILLPMCASRAFSRRDSVTDIANLVRDVATRFFSAGGSEQQSHTHADPQPEQRRHGAVQNVTVVAADDIGGAANTI